MKVTFVKIVKASLYKFGDVFDLFDASVLKIIFYFFMLNLMILFPITWNITQMETLNYARYGMDVVDNIPDWLPTELPADCQIANQELNCTTNNVYEYTFINREKEFTLYLNVDPSVVIDEARTFIMYQDHMQLQLENGTTFQARYVGFTTLSFQDLSEMSQEEATQVLMDGIFQSFKPIFILPIILFIVGTLTLANFILIIMLSAISMFFGFNQDQFPKYKNMFKLMVFASTIPSIINVVLGFYGLSAFTPLVYNFVTPVIAYFMYKASRLKLEIL